jgi:hypothetical protein
MDSLEKDSRMLTFPLPLRASTVSENQKSFRAHHEPGRESRISQGDPRDRGNYHVKQRRGYNN